jgi:hypothetical protein
MLDEGNVGRMYFHRGWYKLFNNIIWNITGLELMDGMMSCQKRGVYIILSIDYVKDSVDIEYIGSSQNMKKRLYGGPHEVYNELAKAQDHFYYSIAVYYIDTSKYKEVEKLLIQALRPKRNKVHNNSKKIGQWQDLSVIQ